MNAAKRIRKLLEENTANDPQLDVLKDLVMSLQLGQAFELSRLYQIDYPYFKLALTLLDDWRLDHHIASRSKLVERLFPLTQDMLPAADNDDSATITAEPAAVNETAETASAAVEPTTVASPEATPEAAVTKPTRKRKQTVTTA